MLKNKKTTLREQIASFKETGNIPGEFCHTHGFYGWFCEDRMLARKAHQLMVKAIKFAKRMRIDLDTHQVYFKNTLPAEGPGLWDEIRFKEIATGDVAYVVLFNGEGCQVYTQEYSMHPQFIAESWSCLIRNIMPVGWRLETITI